MGSMEWPSEQWPSETLDREIKRALLSWYAATGDRAARDLPWRGTRDPYAIWVSETMLQQTRAATVVPYWKRFLEALPTVRSLAEAREDQVLALWSGLGYYRRARMLHSAAKDVVASYGGRLPQRTSALLALDGVGRYTAGAIASIAFNERAAAVDGNVARVLARFFAIEEDVTGADGSARVWAVAARLAAVDEGEPGDWTQALMDLGATVCLPQEPQCTLCPLRGRCTALARGAVRDLPRKKAKRAPTEVRSVAIVLASKAAILLALRQTGALFGGLWEVPQEAWTTGSLRGALRAFATRLGVASAALSVRGEVVHILSHRKMRVTVFYGRLDGRRRFALPGPDYSAIEPVPLSELRRHTRPHATLTRKLLDMANMPGNRLR
jgi:A/G-specific adenine glycosylase